MKIIITEPQFQELIDNGLIPTPKKVFDILCKLSGWTYYNSGLGMEKTIDTILEPKMSKLSDKDIKDNIEGAKILLDNGKINQGNYDRFVRDLDKRKLVYDDNGDWMQVNKLNTNYVDLAELLRDFIFESFRQGGIASKQILETINNTTNLDKIKDVLTSYKDILLKKLKQRYSESPEELFDYVNYSTEASKKGERLENEVRDKFISKYGAQLLYQGGNGNYVDMIYSVDLIMKVKNGNVYTIQVKSNEGQVNTFIKNTNKNQAVDLVAWPGNGGTFNVRKVKSPHKTITI